MIGQARTCVLRGSGGLVLVEVMMAVVLLSLLVVPLASRVLSVTGSADSVRGKTAELCDSRRGSKADHAWQWDEIVWQAWWRPGPALNIFAGSETDAHCAVGVWADGWFIGEWTTNADGYEQIDAHVWAGLSGEELTVRVREGKGAWGPPWRLVVPMADGKPLVSESGTYDDWVETVAHVPGLGNPDLGLSWAGAVAGLGLPGLPIILATPRVGTHEIEVDDRTQSWKSEVGRDLDIYF